MLGLDCDKLGVIFVFCLLRQVGVGAVNEDINGQQKAKAMETLRSKDYTFSSRINRLMEPTSTKTCE